MTAFNHVCVIGLGYIGLPTAVALASSGMQVAGVDINAEIVDNTNAGVLHFVEPDLEDALRTVRGDRTLSATNTPIPADAFLIAVPTPFKGDDHAPDLTYLQHAISQIAPVLEQGNLVVVESTVPVGTTETVATWLAAARPDLTFPQTAGVAADVSIAYCPERVLPGNIMGELVTNDRVIGGMTSACAAKSVALYRHFVTGNCVVASSAEAAELAKLAENSFRDVNIAFANELSMICDRLNVDVFELIRLTNQHPRVNVLQPGPGVGGHCIAVDPWFIVHSAPDEAHLINTARTVNDAKPNWVLSRIFAEVEKCLPSKGNPSDVAIACYGLSYKANSDDLRESPALQIVQQLATRHPGQIFVVEPHINTLPTSIRGAKMVDYSMAAAADVHVMLVDHAAFLSRQKPAGRCIDTRGSWRLCCG